MAFERKRNILMTGAAVPLQTDATEWGEVEVRCQNPQVNASGNPISIGLVGVTGPSNAELTVANGETGSLRGQSTGMLDNLIQLSMYYAIGTAGDYLIVRY